MSTNEWQAHEPDTPFDKQQKLKLTNQGKDPITTALNKRMNSEMLSQALWRETEAAIF